MSCAKCEPQKSRGRTWLMVLGLGGLAVAAIYQLAAGHRPAAGQPSTPQPESSTVLAREAGSYEAELARAYPSEAPRGSSVRKFELEAAPATVPQFDGRALSVWAYNGQVPVPILRVRLGESVQVRLQNHLPQPTTIHWHGVRVPNAMDGVPGVTQDAVAPGGSFTYHFTPKDAGTFWFHPHVRGAEQVERGLYGVLIVDDPEPLPYTRDEVWVLDAWVRMAPSIRTS